MKLYRTRDGVVVEQDSQFWPLPGAMAWDDIFTDENAIAEIRRRFREGRPLAALPPLLAPVQSQPVWAAGVTYLRSRAARMAEAEDAGGGIFYDKVYEAVRPELFFKALPHQVAADHEAVHIRRDSKWNVPEPELTVAFNARGNMIGFTIGNDMSSRDIEGENPLYLPQAKVYDRACALGPGLLLADAPLPVDTKIELEIRRGGHLAYTGATTLANLKRTITELADFLYRECTFPAGCYLLTGTGIVPPDSFTLAPEDRVSITIDPIGTLTNTVTLRS